MCVYMDAQTYVNDIVGHGISPVANQPLGRQSEPTSLGRERGGGVGICHSKCLNTQTS